MNENKFITIMAQIIVAAFCIGILGISVWFVMWLFNLL